MRVMGNGIPRVRRGWVKTFAFAVAASAAVFFWSVSARAEKELVFVKLTDPLEFALAKDILWPHVKPNDYDPETKPAEDRAYWPDTYEKYLREFVRVARGDINDDGVDEIFYYIKNPGYCGSAGCWSLIFERRGEEWKLICGTSFVGSVTITDWVSEGGYRELQDRYVIYWRNGHCYEDEPRTPETEDLPPRGERTWKPLK